MRIRIIIKVLVTASAVGLTSIAGVFPVQAQEPGGPGRERGPRGPGGGPGRMRPSLPVLIVLDKDKDGDLSEEEMADATAALTSLDKNNDGELADTEFLPDFGGRRGGPGGRGRGFGGFFRVIPLISALDADQDLKISADELKNATTSLKRLDKNRDEKLVGSEILPDFGGFGRGRGGPAFGEGDTGVERQDPEEVEFENGTATIPDRTTFEKMSYQGEEVLIDTHLAGNEFVKFQIERLDTDKPQVYFINTKTHRAHFAFMRAVGIPRGGRGPGGAPGQMRGVLVYRPLAKSPSGKPGLYTFEFEPNDNYPFEDIKTAYELLIAKSELLKGNLGYYPMPRAVRLYEEEKAKYDAADFKVYLDKDFLSDIAFLPLNPGESFGRLRVMELSEYPTSRDIVLYKSLPNEMPRVAGIITAVRQTPLSHVNLRAIQDKVPNSFVAGAAEDKAFTALAGKYVFYKVTSQRYEIREATAEEVEAHFETIRPKEPQIPKRDLAMKEVRPLNEIRFEDSASVGVKAANLATMRTFEFPEGTIPDGFAIPFYFYDEFMKHNGFYDQATTILGDEQFKKNRVRQEKALKSFRKRIKAASMPDWMMDALAKVQASFPKGVSIRCRSSTNNEDLPGFSGAGLYDSYSHKPTEGHLAKSVKQVFASMWNFRAYEEREFYRIDHMSSAMGVLMHPNYKREQANGVAVTDDILYQTQGNYYVNTQVGEDLVTNPEEESVPEEILLDWWDSSKNQVMCRSNRTANGEPLLSKEHLDQLSKCLARIHGRFAKLYKKDPETSKFAMEIEFKISREGKLVIKQARPWVF